VDPGVRFHLDEEPIFGVPRVDNEGLESGDLHGLFIVLTARRKCNPSGLLSPFLCLDMTANRFYRFVRIWLDEPKINAPGRELLVQSTQFRRVSVGDGAVRSHENEHDRFPPGRGEWIDVFPGEVDERESSGGVVGAPCEGRDQECGSQK
jgi:hypothetical protein